ncbi:hypothetical protein JXB02_04745 [Candidatus Woesearchaeota archaeon]|nr:hypothetical protein [Candidatus Woesearchaeota archaeon]
MKKRLTQAEEFEIMKLVLDKFLWLGLAIMAFGMWVMVNGTTTEVLRGLSFMVAGAIVLILFMMLIVKEYEIIK